MCSIFAERIIVGSFILFDFCNEYRTIKQLIIVQKGNDSYQHYKDFTSFITIPDTIANLAEVESITITSRIETLPKSVCNLKKLELLDLTGCHNIRQDCILRHKIKMRQCILRQCKMRRCNLRPCKMRQWDR